MAIQQERAMSMSWVEADNFMITKGNNEDNRMYVCVDCSTHALTKDEKRTHHDGHTVLKAFSCSRSYAYRCDDIYGLRYRGLDVSGVAVYDINGKNHFYPKTRKDVNQKTKDGKSGVCRHCGHTLADKPGSSFCSILCKLSSPPGGDQSGVLDRQTAITENQINLEVFVPRNKRERSSKNNKAKSKKRKVIVGPREEKNEEDKNESRQPLLLRFTLCPNSVHSEKGKKGLISVVANNGNNKAKNRKAQPDGSDKKLQGLIAVVADDGNQLSLRKRSRKGTPCRAPFF